MWNRLAPYALKLLDMWNRLLLYVLRLLGRHDPSLGPENEASDNIDLCYQMVNEEDDSRTATGGDYDVFLSFRGPDTRDKFTDCLYEFMHRAGIRVYRDNEELPRGEKISKILQAVKSSQILIPIFSEDYASSKWCLKELACMVESTRQSLGKTILPIFYDVDPSDVKLRTNLYKGALEKHEKECGCAQVKPWKEALKTVATIRGWELKKMRHGKAMADITEEVLQKITIRKRNLPINLVGIDDRIEDIEKLLDCWDTSDVRFVIIYGIGGVGKTTLANAVFNQISPQFEGYSFLSNIQESSSYCGIEKMQRKLVADLFSYLFPETFDFDNGNGIIKERLPNKRVLLVFDGMDEKDKFMQLAEHCTLCHPGSRVIITTRDKSVFPMTKVEELKENIPTGSRKYFLYEMKEMHFDHALQLFNKLAYDADSAPSDLHDLSREVVELAGGLPLVVEVMGSDLGSRRKVDQRSTLENFKEVSREDVLQKLKISYDALDCWAQHIYLDIACIFANKKITNLMYMWKDCGFSPKDKIEVLVNKSLIKIIDHDRIWMHDQLIALGREIFRRENTGKFGDQNRLWCPEKASDMVHYKKGTENVVALALRRSRNNFTREHFANFTNMRVLELDGGNFVGNFENVLPELRWLCWRNCPLQPEANNFLLHRLIILKLSGDITREHWSGWVKIMVASKLKVLKLSGSKSLIKTPCFSKLMSLERLILKSFQNLAEIDPSIGELEQLVYLKIKWCPSLKELPVEIGCLTSLRDLILIQAVSLRYLPDSIGNLRLLSTLAMEDSGVFELPDTMRGLVNLEHLYLANCTSLISLSDAVGELKSLVELDLSGTTRARLPSSIGELKGLKLWTYKSTIRERLRSYLGRMEIFESCFYPGRTLEPVGLDPFILRDYLPWEGFEELATFYVPEFRELNLLGNLLFLRGHHNKYVNIDAEFPLLDDEIMSSSQPILLLDNLLFTLLSCLETQWVSKWKHGFQRIDEALLSLKFCNHHMRKTTKTIINDGLCYRFRDYTWLSIKFSMTAYEYPNRDQSGFLVENVEIVAKFSLPCLKVQLHCPWSSEKLQYFIEMCKLWREKKTQAQGSPSRRSFKNCMLSRLRKTRWGRLQAKRKRYLSWSCLDYHTNKRLLMHLAYFYACYYGSNYNIPETKLLCCSFVLEKGFRLLHFPLDGEATTRLRWGTPFLVKLLREVFHIETPTVKEVYLFFEDIYIRSFRLHHWNWRRSHHKSLARRVLKLTKS